MTRDYGYGVTKKKLVGYRVEHKNDKHTHITVFNRGAKAGTLVVNASDEKRITQVLDVMSSDPIHLVLNEMDARNWTIYALSQESGIMVSTLMAFFSGMDAGKETMARGLSRAFGTSEDLWMGIL